MSRDLRDGAALCNKGSMTRLVAGIALLGASLGLLASPASAHVPLRAAPHAEAPGLEAVVPEPAAIVPFAPAVVEPAKPSLSLTSGTPVPPAVDRRALALGALVLTPLLLVAIPAMPGMMARPVRRSLAVALVVVLGAIAFESAIHSVHHLASEQEAARCSLASASTNVSADVGPGPAVDVALSGSSSSVAVAEAVAPGVPPRRPHAGRAPPLSLPA